MTVLETTRLRLSELSLEDAPFIFDLVNQPSWLRFIGDKKVHSLDDARRYISDGPRTMYAHRGFGLYRVELKDGSVPIGMCGLIKRDTLDDVDIGFAFLPQYWGRGYALEAAAATMDHGRRVLGLPRIVAIVSPDNESSIRLLEKLGLRYQRMIRLASDADEVQLFG
jgi:RimJ/RimL family protein N-acetyltransferase